MFTWMMHPNQPQWFLDPLDNLPYCIEGVLRVLALHGPTKCLTGCCLN